MAKKVTTVLLLISAPCVFAYTATDGAQVLSVAPTKAKAVAVSIYQQKEMLEHELRKLQDDHATGSKDLAADLAATQARLAAVTAKCSQCKTAEDELSVAYTAAIAAHQTTEDILAQLNSLAGLSSAVTAAEALVDKSPLLSAIASYKTLVDAFSAASATQLVGPPDFAAMVTTINAQWDAVKAARDAKTTAEQASTATSPCTDAATGDKVLCTDADRTAAATAETTADNAVTDKKAAQVTACAGMPSASSTEAGERPLVDFDGYAHSAVSVGTPGIVSRIAGSGYPQWSSYARTTATGRGFSVTCDKGGYMFVGLVYSSVTEQDLGNYPYRKVMYGFYARTSQMRPAYGGGQEKMPPAGWPENTGTETWMVKLNDRNVQYFKDGVVVHSEPLKQADDLDKDYDLIFNPSSDTPVGKGCSNFHWEP